MGYDQIGIADTPSRASGGSRLAQVTRAVRNAAARTGVNFAYLMKKAVIESGANPNAQASTSSAAGLYQFTSQTWLRTVKSHGAEYGLGDCADQIEVGRDGVAYVSDPVARQEILSLRKDPEISAEMAGELDKDNSLALQRATGESAGPAELYLAHFLGASGASRFLNTLRANPNMSAADILPKAANSNPSVFYAADGQPRTLGEIYDHFAQRFDQTPEEVIAGVQAAHKTGASASSALAAHMGANRAAFLANLALSEMQLDSMALAITEDDSAEDNTFSLMA